MQGCTMNASPVPVRRQAAIPFLYVLTVMNASTCTDT